MPKQTFFNLPDEKREQILDVVIDEFAENDYANVSISRIVASAGIAKGSFYQYFEDKEDLYGYLLELIKDAKTELFSLDNPDPQHVGIFAYLRWMYETSVQFELVHPRLSQIGYRILNGGVHEEKMLARASEDVLAFYKQLVGLGKQQGDIAPDIDEDLAAVTFHLILTNLGRYMLTRVNEERGPDWQGQQLFIEFPEVKLVFAQALHILEYGMRLRET